MLIAGSIGVWLFYVQPSIRDILLGAPGGVGASTEGSAARQLTYDLPRRSALDQRNIVSITRAIMSAQPDSLLIRLQTVLLTIPNWKKTSRLEHRQ